MKKLRGREYQLLHLKDEQEWPYYPYMPVKRYTDYDLELGILKYEAGKPLVIYDANIVVVAVTGLQVESCKVLATFNSYEEMLDAGWIGD